MDGNGNVIDVLAASAPAAERRSPRVNAARCVRKPIADEHQHVVNL